MPKATIQSHQSPCPDHCFPRAESIPCFKQQELQQDRLSLFDPAESLCVCSPALGRFLTELGKITFTASGTCMYPTILPGDMLIVEPKNVNQLALGEIAIYRRGPNLFGHRIIEMGHHNGRPYIITRPDRAITGDYGPTYGEDVLGRVQVIDRRGKKILPQNQRYTRFELANLHRRLIWHEFWGKLSPWIITKIGNFQQTKMYRQAASRWLKATFGTLSYDLLIPLGPWHGLSQKLSPDEIKELAIGRELTHPDRFQLILKVASDCRPAASIFFVSRPLECPFSGWWLSDLKVRIRYQGSGLEEELIRKAAEIFSRNGVKTISVFLNAKLFRLRHFLTEFGFLEALVSYAPKPEGLSPESAILIKTLESEISHG